MFGLSPLPFYALAFLLFSNLATLTLWRGEVAHHRLTKTEHAEQARKEAEAALARMTLAANVNRRIVAEVNRQELEINRLNKEKNDAIRQLTTGRPCLGSRAVGLLNGAAPPAGPVPGAGPGAVSADGAFASDTDVAAWAADAIRAYDTCRARLGGIAAFYAGAE